MHCPYCRHSDTRVVDSRVAEDGGSIRRRRTCASEECGKRFTTVELVIDQGPQRRQPLIRVDIRFDDIETRRQAIALGAEWDADEKTWRMPRRAAIQLGLIRQGQRGRKKPAEPA